MKRRDFLRNGIMVVGGVVSFSPEILAETLNLGPHVTESVTDPVAVHDFGFIADDFEILVNGDIRYVGTRERTYTLLDLHRFLQDLADQPQGEHPALDIFSNTPSKRLTNQAIELTPPCRVITSESNSLANGFDEFEVKKMNKGDNVAVLSI